MRYNIILINTTFRVLYLRKFKFFFTNWNTLKYLPLLIKI